MQSRSRPRSLALDALMLGAAMLAVLPGAARAQGFDDVTQTTIEIPVSQGATSRKINLGIGKSVIVELPRDAKEVFVANPKVANAVVRSSRKIFLIGVGDGATSVFVFDEAGRQIATLEIAIGRDLNVLRRTLKSAIPKAKVEVVPVGDSIVLTGEVDSASEAQQAADIAKGFVGTAAGTNVAGSVINSLTIKGREQVLLKVTIAEVERSVLKQLGINVTGTSWKIGSTSLGFSDLAAVGIGVANPALAALAPGLIGLNSKGVGGGTTNSTVRALEQTGVLRLLAEPNLTAISGESAKFLAGGEIPVLSNQALDQATQRYLNTYTYRPVGVSLEFTPVVLSEGRISLRVSTEVTEVDQESAVQLISGTIPGFKVRRTSTTVELPSGGTMATAGLIQQKTSQNITGFPGVMNLPIVGALFRSRRYQKLETELMISVTPYIVKPSSPGEITRPDENFVDASDAQAVLLNRLHKIYGVAGPAAAPRAYRGKVGFIND